MNTEQYDNLNCEKCGEKTLGKEDSKCRVCGNDMFSLIMTTRGEYIRICNECKNQASLGY